MKPHHIFHLPPAPLDSYIYNYFLTFLQNKTDIVYVLSLFADIFVLAYPIILIYMYLIGHINDKPNYKKLALQIFTGVLIVAAINIVIQYFIWKDRPGFLNGINLIFEHVPNNSFPSDHMAIGLVFGLILFMSKYIYDADFINAKVIKNTGVVFVILAFVMGFCRIAVGVHRFTDICMGIIIGGLGCYLVYKYDSFLDRYIYQNIIGFQNWLFEKLYINKIIK